MKVGIVGFGVVGSAIARMLARCAAHEVVIYDRYQPAFSGAARREFINACELVFLAVPTPTTGEGCDLTAVEECASWISAPLLIRSTIPPGTVERLIATTGNRAIAFSPEYIGESQSHPWREEGDCGFLIVGGPQSIFERSRKLYESCRVSMRFYRTTARAAELCKYMENCFLATKVAFVNQFFDIAQSMGVAFDELRELWLADPRIGESHTVVTPERGFRGRCLPKDLAALIAAMQPFGGSPLLEAVRDYNHAVCEHQDAGGVGGKNGYHRARRAVSGGGQDS